MSAFPEYVIADERVFSLSFTREKTTRAWNRRLVDYGVVFTDVVSQQAESTLVGASRTLEEDYDSYRAPVPLEWLLARFLTHGIVRATTEELRESDGPVLLSDTFGEYLGESVQSAMADAAVVTVLQTWVRSGVRSHISLATLFASTNLVLDTLLMSINALVALEVLAPEGPDAYAVRGGILNLPGASTGRGLSPSPVSDYYQEVEIEAESPFCFVLMPFKEQEFPQRWYFDVLKPLLEEEIGVKCYRVDEDSLPDRIDNKIYTYLLKSEFVVAEITSKNPNVMYELGLAHAMNKRCVLLTQGDPSDMPFDIVRIAVEPYDDDASLQGYVRKVVSALQGTR